MTQLLILYFLNIKPTHGYEIQKFIQLNAMNRWNNIQSGSIYYAMNQLERKGLIELTEKLGTGEKTKRIYAITEKGKAQLKDLALSELQKPLAQVSCDKFLIYPIFASITKPELILTIEEHLKVLQKKQQEIEGWSLEKVHASTVEKATLHMMQSSILLQINWHMTLLDNIDETLESVKEISDFIAHTDFAELK
ncbi:MAG: PadR family transcriptional regulator [Cellulosilyticaceae bacterium]